MCQLEVRNVGFTIRVMIAELARSAIAILAIFASQRLASTPPMLNAILRRSKMNATLKTSTTRPTAITLGFWAAIFGLCHRFGHLWPFAGQFT
jgi:hypothetical protein